MVSFALLFVHSNSFNIQPRILKGQLSRDGDFPHYVSLYIVGTSFYTLCGGSIIADRYSQTKFLIVSIKNYLEN